MFPFVHKALAGLVFGLATAELSEDLLNAPLRLHRFHLSLLNRPDFVLKTPFCTWLLPGKNLLNRSGPFLAPFPLPILRLFLRELFLAGHVWGWCFCADLSSF